VASAASLASTAEKFAPVGTTALILTKLDESSGLGNLLPLLRASKLPLSYLTNGQNVPEDIEPAERRRLARAVLGMDMAAVA
jgi:flagellar biosynthesis protein FlhF